MVYLAPNISRAASPDEILWSNLGVTPKQQLVSTIVIYLLTIVLIFVTVIVIV